MKIDKLTINDWQVLLARFRTEMKPETTPPIAMRIENTMFTSARYFGSMKYNGETYIYFEPIIPGMPANPDGTPYVAWLMVRDDFVRWASKQKEVKDGEEG